ncbi:MAG: hypothetical protein IT374_11655 [Polyangiaceae bacterium]|nr:hypothetical protein [Polyangiaceae bacterium]
MRALPGLAVLLLAAASGCGRASCPAGRVQGEAGGCVPEDIADFVACVHAAGGATIDRESAKQIGASAVGASGAVGWRDRVKTEWSGPAAEHQRVVIDACIARTLSISSPVASSPAAPSLPSVSAAPPVAPSPSTSPPTASSAAPAPPLARLVGAWVAVRPDGMRNELDVDASGEFRARQVSTTYSCAYSGVLRLDGAALVRTVQHAACAGPTGVADRFELLHVDERSFVVATPDGEVTYVRR